jgi:hypothetical protein
MRLFDKETYDLYKKLDIQSKIFMVHEELKFNYNKSEESYKNLTIDYMEYSNASYIQEIINSYNKNFPMKKNDFLSIYYELSAQKMVITCNEENMINFIKNALIYDGNIISSRKRNILMGNKPAKQVEISILGTTIPVYLS